MHYLVVKFDVHSITVVVHSFECMASISVHESEAIRCSSVRIQEGELVSCFRTLPEKVPYHTRVLMLQQHIIAIIQKIFLKG